MGDMPTNTRIYKIKSSPALKCASRSSKLGNEKFEETYFVSMRPTKKLKRDVNDDTSVVTFQEPKSIVTKIFQKPQQTIIVEYCNVLKSTGATKYPSAVSQDMSTSLASTSVTKQNLGSYASTKSWEQRSNHENCQRKWKGITERNNAMRLERMKKLKEMELQKLQEKEKAQKTEIARRRAMIAKIREQNRKFLMEHKGWKLGGNASSDNGPSNDEIILPVVHVKANGATRNDHIDAYDFQANAPSVGNLDEEVPVLRLTQRTLTIERTAKISKLNNEGRSNEMKTKRLQMSDEMRQNVIEEKPGQIIPKCTEYYLMSKETPTKRLVYIEKKHNSSVMPSVTLANKSVSEIFTQSIETFGDLRQVRSNLKTFSSQEVFEKPVSSIRNYPPLDSENVQDNHFNSDSGDKNQTTAVISQTILNVSEPVLIISEPVGNISEPVLILSEPIENISEPNVNGIQLNINENQSNLNDIQPNLNDIQPELNNIQAPCELEQFSSVDTHPSSGSQSGDANDNAIQTGEEIIENADPPTGGEMKTTVECVTPIQTPRVESIPSPLLPNASLNSKNQNQRPIIKRARRRLQKEPSVSDSPENKIQQPEPMGAIDQKKEAIQQNEVQTESKPQNVRAYVPKSLLLKKIELKKRLEERRGACRFTPLNDSLPAGTEINQNVDQSLEETSPISTKTLIERPAATLNKPRRFSLDGNGNKTKLNQTRTPASTHPFKKCVTRKVPSTVSTMKRGSSKSQVSKQEQTVHAGKKTESPQVRKVSTPRASCNRQTSAEPNRPQSYLPIIKTEIIHTTIDGTYCRKNSVGSPSNRRLCTKNNPPANANQCLPDLASDIKTNSPDRRKNKECQGNDQNITSPKAETAPISTPKSWNASKTTQEQSTAETKLPSESDNEVIMSDNTGIITDCPKNKRSDFLAFQMDTSGHPVPVKHINASFKVFLT